MVRKTFKLFCFATIFLVGLIYCNFRDKTSGKATVINFSEENKSTTNSQSNDTLNKLSVAVAAIISPRETFSYYEDLLKYVSRKIDYKLEFKQRKTYQEVNRLIENNEVNLAFICSGAYIEGKDQNTMELLAVPVCDGHPYYQAYIIVHKSSAIERFTDLKGKSFAFTDPMSNTGKLFADKRLRDIGYTESGFFKSTLYSYAHDVSIQLVAKQMVDGATVDGLIFDYLKTIHPERVKNVRIIEKSEYFGIPPVVVPSGLNPELKEKLRNILITMHEDASGKEILDKLLIDKFVAGNDAEYNSLRKIKQELR